jgi:spermidine/putrescine transport system permease protein
VRFGRILLFSGPVLWVLGANVAPLIEMARISLLDVYPAAPAHISRVSLDNYARFLATPPYVAALLRSGAYAAMTTVMALIVAYPLAYMIARKTPRRRRLRHLLLLIAPFWTSEIVRLFGVMLLLANRGAVNGALQWVGLVDDPLPLLYNPLSIVLGMLYIVLLAMLLPLYAALEKMPTELLDAAAGLGAPPWRRLLWVTLPLTRDGIASGCALVFLVSLGAFAVPALLGGAGATLFATTIGSLFASSAGRWPLGAAFSFILLASGLGIAGLLVRLIASRTLVRDLGAAP